MRKPEGLAERRPVPWRLDPAAGAAAALAAAVLAVVAFPPLADLSRLDPLLSLCLASQPPTGPRGLAAAWSLAPVAALPLLVWLILAALPALRSAWRGGPPANAAAVRLAIFLTGWLLLALALLSPLCRLAATTAWAHMVQHVILVALAPPLLALGRRPSARPAGPPLPAWPTTLLYGLGIWLAHLPAIYQAALLDPAAHLLLTGGLAAAGYLFWLAWIDRLRSREAAREGAVVSAAMALVTLIHTGVLGALLTFSPNPWYPLLAARAAAWGLSPIEDQQLAGLIMWVPMGGLYLAAGVVAMAIWLGALPRLSSPGADLLLPRS